MIGLDESYRRCREVNRRHGTSFYLATWLLPAAKRRHVHALYAFCRSADDIVDDPGPAGQEERAAALDAFGRRFVEDVKAGHSDDPVLAAVVHTVTLLGIDIGCFERFLRSMAMDLTVRSYPTFEQLLGYMDGSAAAIGEMMLPVLEPLDPAAVGPARDLGIAFQLTNFCRDVGEDLDRGRVYLPAEDVQRFGAGASLRRRSTGPEWAALMGFEIQRARRYYRSADAGIAMLPAPSARCVGAARRIYSRILDEIERADYDVFARRARVASWRKAAMALGTIGRSMPKGSPP